MTEARMRLVEEGIELGKELGREEGFDLGREEGIKAFVLDNLEEHVPEERVIEKLQRYFQLGPREARAHFERYAHV